MPSLFKPSYTQTDPETALKVSRKTRKWYGQFTDPDGQVHRVPLCTDRSAAQAMLNELIKKAERRCAGLTDPYEENRKKPLADHLDDFKRNLYPEQSASETLEAHVDLEFRASEQIPTQNLSAATPSIPPDPHLLQQNVH